MILIADRQLKYFVMCEKTITMSNMELGNAAVKLEYSSQKIQRKKETKK